MGRKATTELTEKQKKVFLFIEDFIKMHHYPPTYQEISEAFQGKGGYAIIGHVDALVKKGRIRKKPGVSRGIEITKDESDEEKKFPLLRQDAQKREDRSKIGKRVGKLSSSDAIAEALEALAIASRAVAAAQKQLKQLKK